MENLKEKEILTEITSDDILANDWFNLEQEFIKIEGGIAEFNQLYEYYYDYFDRSIDEENENEEHYFISCKINSVRKKLIELINDDDEMKMKFYLNKFLSNTKFNFNNYFTLDERMAILNNYLQENKFNYLFNDDLQLFEDVIINRISRLKLNFDMSSEYHYKILFIDFIQKKYFFTRENDYYLYYLSKCPYIDYLFENFNIIEKVNNYFQDNFIDKLI